MHQIKGFLNFLLVLLLALFMIGCSKDSIQTSAKITPPEEYDITISGNWVVQKAYTNNYSINDNKSLDSTIGKTIFINKNKIQLLSKTCYSPSFKIKTVDSTSYLVGTYGITPSSLEIDQPDIQVITVTNKDNYFVSFIKLNNYNIIAVLDNNFFLLSKKVDSLKDLTINNHNTFFYEKNNVHTKSITTHKPLSTYAISSKLSSGLLIGLKSYNLNLNKISYDNKIKTIKEPIYRTIWMDLGNNSIKSMYQVPYLLVARKNGFWNIKTKSTINSNSIKCKTFSYPISKNADSTSLESDIINDSQAYSLEDILFIGDDYISLDIDSKGIYKGQSHEKVLRVRPIDTLNNTDSSISLSKLMGEQGIKALKQGAATYITSLNFKDREKLNYAPNENNFGIARKNGQWVLKGRLNYSSEASTRSFADFDIPIIPPKELVKYDFLYPNWNTIKQKVPDAIDAYSSPDRNFIVILTKYKLLIYNITGNKINNNPLKVLNLRTDETVVMSQWATGAYVKSWDEEIEKLTK